MRDYATKHAAWAGEIPPAAFGYTSATSYIEEDVRKAKRAR